MCVYQLSGQHRCSEQPSTRRECSTSPTPLLSGGRPLRGTQTWSHQSHSATVRSTLFPFTWPTDSQRRAWEISLRAKEPPRICSNQPGTEPRPSTLDPRRQEDLSEAPGGWRRHRPQTSECGRPRSAPPGASTVISPTSRSLHHCVNPDPVPSLSPLLRGGASMSPPPPLFTPGLQPGRSYSEAAGGRHGPGGRKWRNAGLCFLRLTSPFLPVATERGAEQTAVRAAACESLALGFVGPIGLVGTRPVNVSHDKREDRQVTGAEAAGHRGAEGGWGRVPELLPPPRPSSLTARHPALSSVWEAHSFPAPEAGDGERREEPDGKGLGSKQLEPDATVTGRSIEVSASEPETVSATRAASASLTTFTPETITRGGQRGKGGGGAWPSP